MDIRFENFYGKRILCLNKMSKGRDWVRRIKMSSILLGSVDRRTDSLSGQRHFKLQAGRGGAAAPHLLATSQPNVQPIIPESLNECLMV